MLGTVFTAIELTLIISIPFSKKASLSSKRGFLLQQTQNYEFIYVALQAEEAPRTYHDTSPKRKVNVLIERQISSSLFVKPHRKIDY